MRRSSVTGHADVQTFLAWDSGPAAVLRRESRTPPLAGRFGADATPLAVDSLLGRRSRAG
jgi:hypothetical protein